MSAKQRYTRFPYSLKLKTGNGTKMEAPSNAMNPKKSKSSRMLKITDGINQSALSCKNMDKINVGDIPSVAVALPS